MGRQPHTCALCPRAHSGPQASLRRQAGQRRWSLLRLRLPEKEEQKGQTQQGLCMEGSPTALQSQKTEGGIATRKEHTEWWHHSRVGETFVAPLKMSWGGAARPESGWAVQLCFREVRRGCGAGGSRGSLE